MTDTKMTFGNAQEVQYMYDRYKAMADNGTIMPDEMEILKELEAQLGIAQEEIGATGATYRGFQRGVTGGLSDDIAGVTSFVRGDGYGAGRQASLDKDIAAREAYPTAFGTGEMAGGATLAGGSMAVGGPALKGLGMLGKMTVGGTAGTALGALQGQSDYEMAGSPEGERWDYYKSPMMIGGGLGLAAYPFAAAVGKGVGAVHKTRKAGGLPMRTLGNAVKRTEEAGTDIRRFLDDLTPEAMLADVPGDLQGTAQGLAAIRGPGGTRVAREINERAAGAGRRITDEVDTRIGPPNAAFEQRRASAAARTTLGPEYDAALNAEGAINVSALRRKLDEAIRVAGPDTGPVLRSYADDLARKAENGLIAPEQLHWLRSDLARKLRELEKMGGGKSKLLSNALEQFDEILDTVPGYKAARTAYGNTFAMDEAVEAGEDMLRGTRRTALAPDEFQVYWDTLSDAQKDAFRTGVRRDIAALMGTSRNDAAAAWRELTQKGWNEEKLRIVLGREADPLIKRLRGEKVYSETGGRVVAGTRTSETTASRERLTPYVSPETGMRPGPLTRARAYAGDRASSLVDRLMYRGLPEKNAELGRLLTLQGNERDALVQQLLAQIQGANVPPVIAKRTEDIVRALIAGTAGAATAGQQ